MKRILVGTGMALTLAMMSASPALAHLCQNVNKPAGAGGAAFKELPNGKEVATGAWVDIEAFTGLEECAGLETNIRVYLHPADQVGGPNGIQPLTDDCIAALLEFFEG